MGEGGAGIRRTFVGCSSHGCEIVRLISKPNRHGALNSRLKVSDSLRTQVRLSGPMQSTDHKWVIISAQVASLNRSRNWRTTMAVRNFSDDYRDTLIALFYVFAPVDPWLNYYKTTCQVYRPSLLMTHYCPVEVHVVFSSLLIPEFDIELLLPLLRWLCHFRLPGVFCKKS